MLSKGTRISQKSKLSKVHFEDPFNLLSSLENGIVKIAVRRVHLFRLFEVLEDFEEALPVDQERSDSLVA